MLIMKKCIFVTLFVIELLSFSACDKNANGEMPSDVGDIPADSPLGMAVSMSIATEEQSSDTEGYIHFYDQDSIDTNWSVIITVNAPIKDFRFVELDESEELRMGKVLYEEETPPIGSSYMFHTYINDVALNRGISYQDQDGSIRYFGIYCDMKDGSVCLKEIEL